jgi:hypothetical protein
MILYCECCGKEIVKPSMDGWLEWIFSMERMRNEKFRIVHNFKASPPGARCTLYPSLPPGLQDWGLSLFLGHDGLKHLLDLKDAGADESIESVLDRLHPRQHAYSGRIGRLVSVGIPEGGGVYFVAANETGKIKIGFSENFSDRFRSLKTSSPAHLRFVGCIHGASQQDERGLHERFSSLRMPSTEWFTAADEMIDMIVDEGWGEIDDE